MTQEDIDLTLSAAEEAMQASIEHLTKELMAIRAGKASPAMINSLTVSYYGIDTPLNQVANISAADSRTLVIQPWEKSMIGPIEKAIFEANLGVTPQNDGELVRITIPMLTEERRKELVKRAKALGEEAKVSIRNERREAIQTIKKAVKEGYPEDLGRDAEAAAQKLTDKYSAKVDQMIEAKEKDIMTI
ncbi:MAG: ribosome recycling factor [Bacteroidetes bacterium]|nr:MAG: ribosome recycling factor [Bacteroidota bacterium]